MKKKGIVTILAATLLVLICFTYVGCNQTPADTTPKEYVIQYTDDSGTYKITVTDGMPYTLDVVPTKAGYKFMGLFDAEIGGTQYVSASGASLSPFTDGKNMVLFPQFKANDYTVVLDYQGAQVTGARQLTVGYGSSLPELPKNLTGDHKIFSGWYTSPNCQGVKVADQYGLIPVVSVLNDTNFDLSADLIYLYAGFEVEKHTVTCFFEAGMDAEEIQVEYDTPVSQIVPETRVDGKAPLTWSKTQGGEVFNGKITGDTVLYALEYAPVIDFDVNGGNKVNSLVARAGSTVALPTPTKDLAKFTYWEDMQGNKYDRTTMPESSISLKAVWQAKLVFDANGGSDVKDISEKAGTTIELPTPEKEGFIFAGWYNADKEKYTSTRMPAAGIELKAGWYKEKVGTKIFINANGHDRGSDMTSPSTYYLCYMFKFSDFFDVKEPMLVKIDWHTRIMIDGSNHNAYVNFYSQKQISTSYLMESRTFANITNFYKELNFSTSFTISDDFYCCWYSNAGGAFTYTNLKDFYCTVHYADTTNLYL